jgi:oligopeptide transport system substrate-binding protein
MSAFECFAKGASRHSVFISACSLVIVVLTGCSIQEKPADLRIINGKEPESLDPATVVGQPDERVCLSCFEGLTRYNAVTAAPEPALAEKWEISPDGKTYTFHIRSNAVWSNGDPITAQDFVYSWIRVLEPATAGEYAGNLYYVKNAEDYNTGKISDPNLIGVHALDPHTLLVELVNPTAFFLDLCAFPTQAIVHRKTIERYGDRWLNSHPPVSGAYELVSWSLNDKIRIKKNPRYWEASMTSCDLVDLMPVNSPNTALNLFMTHAVDIVWDKDVVPSELIDVLRGRPDFHTFEYLGSYFYRYNVTHKPFDDPRVRKALALVIDKKRIVERVTKGGERPASFYVPPGMPHYDPPEGLGYDPDLGRKLLAEAGFAEGKGFRRFNYLFNTSRDHEKIAVELQDMWRRELGIEVELKSVEWKVYLNMQASLDYDLSRSSWIGDYNDPNTFLDMFMSNNGNNRTGWKNENYDSLMRQANATVDVNAREKLLQQAELMLIKEEMPITPLYIYVGMNFFDTNKISGVYNNLRDEHPIRAIRKAKD